MKIAAGRIASGAALAVAAILFLVVSPGRNSRDGAAESPQATLTASASAPAPERKEDGEIARDEEHVNESLSEPPDEKTIRDEVAQDPHRTPPGLIAYAVQLGKELDAALTSETRARIYLEKMRSCLSSDSRAAAAQVLCLRHSELVARAYPTLDAEAAELNQLASPQVREIAGDMEKID